MLVSCLSELNSGAELQSAIMGLGEAGLQQASEKLLTMGFLAAEERLTLENEAVGNYIVQLRFMPLSKHRGAAAPVEC